MSASGRAPKGRERGIADIATASYALTMTDADRFEIVKGSGPDGRFAELWDRSLAPAGLAFEAVEASDGSVTVIGYRVAAPLSEVERYIFEAKAYLRNV